MDIWNSMLELAFRKWFNSHAKQQGFTPDPDDARHAYDWRKAFLEGATPNEEGHWPSKYKYPWHPTAVIMKDGNLWNTITNKPFEGF
jgi:hypothetical protein